MSSEAAAAPERARLFVALELPPAVREALVRWREPLVRGLRPVAPESLHVTLCFLGWQALEEAGAIARACVAVAGSDAPSLALDEGLWLPPRRPRVLAVSLADAGGRLGSVQAELSRALEGGGWYTPEKRSFLPHTTVARVPARASIGREPLPPVDPLEFVGSRVTLMRSRLSPRGAAYEPLASVELG